MVQYMSVKLAIYYIGIQNNAQRILQRHTSSSNLKIFKEILYEVLAKICSTKLAIY